MPHLDEDGGPASGEALLAAIYERASANDPNGDGAQSFLFLRGAADPTIDGLVARATHAREWPRVVELRLDRAQTLATVGQRVQELSGIARILQVELRDPNGAVDVLEQARALAPTRVTVVEALRRAYEASGRAPPIDPAEYAKAFATHWRGRQTDAALLDAMVLEEVGVAEPEHEARLSETPWRSRAPTGHPQAHRTGRPASCGAVSHVISAPRTRRQSARRPEGFVRVAGRSSWLTGYAAPSSPQRAPDCFFAESSRPPWRPFDRSRALPDARPPSASRAISSPSVRHRRMFSCARDS